MRRYIFDGISCRFLVAKVYRALAILRQEGTLLQDRVRSTTLLYQIENVGPYFHQLIYYVINHVHTLSVAKRGLFLWRKSSGMNDRILSMTSKLWT